MIHLSASPKECLSSLGAGPYLCLRKGLGDWLQKCKDGDVRFSQPQAGAEVLSHPSCPHRTSNPSSCSIRFSSWSQVTGCSLDWEAAAEIGQASYTLLCDYGLLSPLTLQVSRSALESRQIGTVVLKSPRWEPGHCSASGPEHGATQDSGTQPLLGTFPR